MYHKNVAIHAIRIPANKSQINTKPIKARLNRLSFEIIIEIIEHTLVYALWNRVGHSKYVVYFKRIRL